MFDGVQHGYDLLRELHIEDGSGYRNFVRMTKSDMEIMLQKTGLRIQGKDTKFREAIPPSIRLAVTLRYLTSSNFSPNFGSNDFISFCKKINRITFLITIFVICTTHILQTRSALQILNKSTNSFVRHVNRSNSTSQPIIH